MRPPSAFSGCEWIAGQPRQPSSEPSMGTSAGARKRWGDPIGRFWSHVAKADCWEWSGSRWPGGYGIMRLGDRRLQAHRFSWELHRGPIPTGLCVCHRCDNPPCVNPAHLFLGTHLENVLDSSRKGRRHTSRNVGERNGGAKLTADQVHAIRAAAGRITQIARSFGVSSRAIRDIRAGRKWISA